MLFLNIFKKKKKRVKEKEKRKKPPMKKEIICPKGHLPDPTALLSFYLAEVKIKMKV